MKKTVLTSFAVVGAFCSLGQMRQTNQSVNLVDYQPYQVQTQAVVSPIPAAKSQARIQNSWVFTQRAPCIDTLLFENFQTETIPGTWGNLDLDGATDANGRAANWYPLADMQTTTPGDTNYVAASSSWFSPAGTAANWLILDAVAPCASTVLRWKSAPFEGPTFMDGYQVRISTTGTNIGDFSTTIFTAAESLNGTATPTAGTVHTSYNATNGVLQEWEVSLGAYDNQTVYIAFFHNSNDDNMIMIDDIFMGTLVPFDLSIQSSSTEPYYSTPLAQVTPRTFTAELGLTGGSDVTNPTSNVEVFQGATSVFTNAPSAASLSSGNSVTLTSTAYTPVAVDTFTTVFTASAVETDPNLADNVDSLEFVVSDSVYARSNGNVTGALSIGAGSSGVLGNMYEVVVNDILTSVTFTLTAPTVGDTVVGVVYDMVAGTPNQVIATTDTLFVTSAAQAEYTLPVVGGNVSLVAGTYMVGLQESTSAGVTLATDLDAYIPNTAWVFFGGTWALAESFNFEIAYVMNANFGDACSDPVAAFTNAANGLNIAFTDNSTNSVTAWAWDFGDGNTSTMQNPSHTYAADGMYTVCLIVNDACGADTTCVLLDVSSCATPTASYTSVPDGSGSVDFTSTSTTTGATTYLWDFGDGNTATTQNATNDYGASGPGTYTICLTVTDSCGTDSTCMNLVVNWGGIDEITILDQISVYPVPTSDQLNLTKLPVDLKLSFEVVNSLGQVILTQNSNGTASASIDLSNVASGYYHLRISSEELINTRTIIKK